MPLDEKAANAVHGGGGGGPSPHSSGRSSLPFTVLLLGTSVATAGVALWLSSVIALVLPARDPARIPMWRAVALALFAYSTLCWTCLAGGPKRALPRWTLLVASVAAIGLGLYAVVGMVRQANEGGHFEDYLLLMGLILIAHSISGAAYALRAGRTTRPPAGSSAGPATTRG